MLSYTEKTSALLSEYGAFLPLLGSTHVLIQVMNMNY